MTPRVLRLAAGLILDGERLSKYDLAERAPCHQRTAQRVLIRLSTISRVVRRVAWVKHMNQRIAVYGFGVRDKRKPRAMTACEIARRRRKENPELCIDEMFKKRQMRLKAKIKERCNGANQ